jgi:hypothetical protein
MRPELLQCEYQAGDGRGGQRQADNATAAKNFESPDDAGCDFVWHGPFLPLDARSPQAVIRAICSFRA